MSPAVSGIAPTASRPRSWYERWDLRLWIPVSLAFMVFSALQVLREGKPLGFDLENYEFSGGFGAVHGFGNPTALVGLLQTYQDAEINALYYVMIDHLSARTAVIAVTLLQSLSLTAIAIVTRIALARLGVSHRLSVITGVLAGLAAGLCPIYLDELGSSNSDALLILPIVVSTALLARALVSAGSRPGYRAAVAGGALLGLAVDLKWTLFVYAGGLYLGYFAGLAFSGGWRGRGRRRTVVSAFLPVSATVGAAALTYAPLGILLWRRYRNPAFPYFNGVFPSVYVRPGNFRDRRYVATSLSDLWRDFTALVYSPHGEHLIGSVGARSPLLFAALITVMASWCYELAIRRRPLAVFLTTSYLSVFVLWAFAFGIYRYLAAEESVAAAVIAVCLADVLRYRAIVLVTEALLVAGCLLTSVYPTLGRAGFAGSYFGLSRGEFSGLAHSGVVIAGDPALGFVEPYLPAGVWVVRTGGNLEGLMTPLWWDHVAQQVRATRRPWVVIYQEAFRGEAVTQLEQAGLSGHISRCHSLPSAAGTLRVCQAGRVPRQVARALG